MSTNDIDHISLDGAKLRSSWCNVADATIDTLVWTGKASIYADYVTFCGAYDAEPEPAPVFWKNLPASFDIDPQRAVLMVEHRDVIHLRVAGIRPLRACSDLDNPYAGPNFAVLPSGRRPY